MSTLEQELRLVTAYLSIMRVHAGDRLDFDVEASPQSALSAAIPPMILLPLVDHLVVVARSDDKIEQQSIHVVARVDANRVRVEVRAAGDNRTAEPDRGVLADIRERLNALYGDRGRLSLDPSDALGSRLVLELPDEPADRDHR
jgi:LytS/YehU family sensor histidine kinase